MSLRRPLEDESLVDESLVKKRKALSTVVVVPDDSQSLVVLESHVEAQAPAAQAEEISKEEYQRVKAVILAMKPMKPMTEAAPPKAMKPMKKWKLLPSKEWFEYAGSLDEVVPEWEAIPLEAFWKNGRVKFKYIIIEREA